MFSALESLKMDVTDFLLKMDHIGNFTSELEFFFQCVDDIENVMKSKRKISLWKCSNANAKRRRLTRTVREKIKRDEESNRNLEKGENTLSSGGSCYETCGEEEQVFIVPIKRRSGDVLEKIQKKVVSYNAYICLKEELRDTKEAVEALKQKADHFEEIIKLKNIQITDLQKQVDKKAGKKQDETKEQITGPIENTSLINQSVSEPGSSRGSVVEVYLSKSEAICKEDLNQTESEIKSLETPLPVKMEVDKQEIKVENN